MKVIHGPPAADPAAAPAAAAQADAQAAAQAAAPANAPANAPAAIAPAAAPATAAHEHLVMDTFEAADAVAHALSHGLEAAGVRGRLPI